MASKKHGMKGKRLGKYCIIHNWLATYREGLGGDQNRLDDKSFEKTPEKKIQLSSQIGRQTDTLH